MSHCIQSWHIQARWPTRWLAVTGMRNQMSGSMGRPQPSSSAFLSLPRSCRVRRCLQCANAQLVISLIFVLSQRVAAASSAHRLLILSMNLGGKLTLLAELFDKDVEMTRGQQYPLPLDNSCCTWPCCTWPGKRRIARHFNKRQNRRARLKNTL